jgi:hypothetical protein
MVALGKARPQADPLAGTITNEFCLRHKSFLPFSIQGLVHSRSGTDELNQKNVLYTSSQGKCLKVNLQTCALEISAYVNGGQSRGPSVRRTRSEDPHHERKFKYSIYE